MCQNLICTVHKNTCKQMKLFHKLRIMEQEIPVNVLLVNTCIFINVKDQY